MKAGPAPGLSGLLAGVALAVWAGTAAAQGVFDPRDHPRRDLAWLQAALSAGAAQPDWVAISAPVQPGNSGGPLLSDMGEVVGVVVARANDGFYLKETGTLPQNINFAVRPERLRRFLADAGVALPAATDPAEPLSQGLAAGTQAAIQPVFCS